MAIVRRHTRKIGKKRVPVRKHSRKKKRKASPIVYKERSNIIRSRRRENISLGEEAQSIRDSASKATFGELPILQSRFRDIKKKVAVNNAVIDKTNEEFFPKNPR